MPAEVSIAATEGQDGMDFSNILRSSLACGVIVTDGGQKIISLNPQAERITRCSAAGVMHEGIEALPTPLQAVIHETLTTGKPVVDRHLILHRETQGGLTLQVNTALTNGGGKHPGVIVILNDISAARLWESNLRRLDRLHSVSTLSASMAHEIKNAFVAVRTFVDLLLEKNPQADLVEIVRLEMNRIDAIIAQMLKFSGPAKPALSSIRLHCVLDKSLKLIQHLLKEKKITVTRSFEASPDALTGDPDQLEQAFINLFFNALDAMGSSGRLSVATETVAPGAKVPGLARDKHTALLRVTVQDNGMGIPRENMDRLFEPFFTTKPDGTGLGLAITHRILQDHGGAITVKSEVNHGTAFTLLLPASA